MKVQISKLTNNWKMNQLKYQLVSPTFFWIDYLWTPLNSLQISFKSSPFLGSEFSSYPSLFIVDTLFQSKLFPIFILFGLYHFLLVVQLKNEIFSILFNLQTQLAIQSKTIEERFWGPWWLEEISLLSVHKREDITFLLYHSRTIGVLVFSFFLFLWCWVLLSQKCCPLPQHNKPHNLHKEPNPPHLCIPPTPSFVLICTDKNIESFGPKPPGSSSASSAALIYDFSKVATRTWLKQECLQILSEGHWNDTSS